MGHSPHTETLLLKMWGVHLLIPKAKNLDTGLDEAQAGIYIAGRDINNLRYVDDTTLMKESEEELKGLLMKGKEESGKNWLKTHHSEN